jgi:hypothetical protein
MGILDNFENSLNDNFEFESKPMPETDAMGREKFWEDIGRPDFDSIGIYSIEGLALQPEEPNLAVKLFSETCCTNCNCKTT